MQYYLPFSEFRRFLLRNAAHNAALRFYGADKGNYTDRNDEISICDLRMPQRRGEHVEVPHEASHNNREHSNYISSFVCNCTVRNGTIHLNDDAGEWHERDPFIHGKADRDHWKKRPARGMRTTTEMLLGHGCLRRTQEVEDLLERSRIPVSDPF